MNIRFKFLLGIFFVSSMVVTESIFSGKSKVKKQETKEVAVKQEQISSKSYVEEEVTFVNSRATGVTLVGTLRLPKTTKSAPVVLFIGGSGKIDRKSFAEEQDGGAPQLYLDLAEYLADRGIASLIVDKRGYGKSTGAVDWIHTTLEDSASDARAGVEYLKTRCDIDSKKIGLIGHSEGGIIAPMVAVQSKDVAFIVLLATSVLDGLTWMIEDHRKKWLSSGIPLSDVEKYLKNLKQWCEIVQKTPSDKEAIKRLKRIGAREDQCSVIVNPHARSMMARRPVEVLRQVSVPVLALFAEGDSCSDFETNMEPLAKALHGGVCVSSTVKVIDGLLPINEIRYDQILKETDSKWHWSLVEPLDKLVHMFICEKNVPTDSSLLERLNDFNDNNLVTSPKLLQTVSSWVIDRVNGVSNVQEFQKLMEQLGAIF